MQQMKNKTRQIFQVLFSRFTLHTNEDSHFGWNITNINQLLLDSDGNTYLFMETV